MGIKLFAKKMFKADIKKNKFLIFIVLITTIIVINAVNVSYLTEIFDGSGDTILITGMAPGGGFNTPPIEYEMPIELIQKQALFTLLSIAFLFVVMCNLNFIKTKSKEMAFVISNGGSLFDLIKYLQHVIGGSFFIGIVLGFIIGTILTPVFNILIYMLVGVWGNVFSISFMGLGVSAIFLMLLYSLIMMITVGHAYRKEPIELIKSEKTKSKIDKRVIKTPGFIFFFIYVMTIGINISLIKTEGADKAAFSIGFLGLVGIYGVIKYFIPQTVKWLKKKKFMYKGLRRIYISNFQKAMEDSLLYILVFYGSIHYLTNLVAEYSDSSYIVNFVMFAIIGTSIIIYLSLIYNLTIDLDDKINSYKQMKILGYKKEEILEVCKKEYLAYFLIGIGLPIVMFISMFVIYVSVGSYSVLLACEILGGLIIPITIVGLFVVRVIKKNINEKLYS